MVWRDDFFFYGSALVDLKADLSRCMLGLVCGKSRRLRENILMRIYDDVDMDAPEMASAKAGLDALVEELKNAAQSKVCAPFPTIHDGCYNGSKPGGARWHIFTPATLLTCTEGARS